MVKVLLHHFCSIRRRYRHLGRLYLLYSAATASRRADAVSVLNADHDSKLKRLPAGNGGATRCSSGLQTGWGFHICVSRPSSPVGREDRLTIRYGSPARRRFRSSHMVVAEHEYGFLRWRYVPQSNSSYLQRSYVIQIWPVPSTAVHVSLAAFPLLGSPEVSLFVRSAHDLKIDASRL